MADWTLEGELRTAAEAADLPAALCRLGLIDSPDRPFDVVTTRTWYRSGAETYALLFDVRQPDNTSSYIIKACIAWSPSETFSRWLDRRRVLEEIGVRTPTLVGVGRALLIEEYIDHLLLHAMAKAEDETRQTLIANVGHTAGLLVKAGFSPVTTHDWRSRGDDVVLVDFGQDLGSPGVATNERSTLLSTLADRISTEHVEPTPAELRLLEMSYEDALIQ